MSYATTFEDWVPYPVARVFLFFADPNSLPRIMPPSTGTRIEQLRLVPPPPSPNSIATNTPLAGVSSEIVTSFRIVPVLPFRMIWIAHITEFVWNQYFVDTQTRGPFQNWTHRHEVSAETRNGISGTLVRDQIEYEIGFGPAGRIAQALFVRRQLNSTFTYRQKTLERLLKIPGTLSQNN
jgi:ligand-binding SRPBCC domain-containing protein